MKKVISILVMLLSVGAQAHLPVGDTVFTSDLTKVTSEHQLLKDVTQAKVEINSTKQTVKVTFYHELNCRPDEVCIMMLPPPTIMTLPLISVEQSFCGSVVYTAVKDQRPVDGLKQEFVLVDNFENQCPTFNVLPVTEFSYHTTLPLWPAGPLHGNDSISSRFEGTELIQLPQYH